MNTIKNKYTLLYFKLVNKSSLSDYTEIHHIIPRSLGGSNIQSNLIKLSAREHFICHYLLTKMFEKNSVEYYKMIKAFMKMKATNTTQKRYFNSYLYELKRKEFSLAQSYCQSGSKNSQFGKIWIHSLDEKRSISIDKSTLKEWISKGWIIGRKLKFDNSEVQPTKREINKQKIEKEAIDTFYIFKHGNFSSVRDFCRKYNNKSHVYTLRIWKKYIIGLETVQGKELIFK